MILSLCRLVLLLRSLCVGFVVNKVALGQVFLQVLWFSLLISFLQCCILFHLIYYQHFTLSLVDIILQYNSG
jgi:hypothetical protein